MNSIFLNAGFHKPMNEGDYYLHLIMRNGKERYMQGDRLPNLDPCDPKDVVIAEGGIYQP